MTLSPAQKKLIYFLSSGLIFLAVFVILVIFTLISKIQNTSAEYLVNQEILIDLGRREILAQELEKDYQDKQADLTGIEDVFLDYQEAVGFISTLETIAQQTGNIFEIKSVTPFTPLAGAGQTQTGTQKQEPFLTFQISLLGDFKSLLLFLANLENSPFPPYRLLGIENLSIKRLEEKSSTLETAIGIKIYTQ